MRDSLKGDLQDVLYESLGIPAGQHQTSVQEPILEARSFAGPLQAAEALSQQPYIHMGQGCKNLNRQCFLYTSS